jgi:hypothetical protein
MPPAAPNPPPPPPPPGPPPVPTFALPVIVTAPLPLPVVVQQQPGTGQPTNITTGPLPPPPPPNPPPPLAVGTLPAVPVNLVQVAAPVPVLVLNPSPGGVPPTPSAKNEADDIYERISQALVATVNGIGDALQKVASLDPRVFVDGLNALVERVPLVGSALAAINNQIASFVDAVHDTARRLSGFSPDLAVATAQADVAQILGDVRRAQQLGSGLTRFTEAESRLSQTAQDILASLLERLLPLATGILEVLANVLQSLPGLADGLGQKINAAVAGATGRTVPEIAATAAAIAGLGPVLAEIARNTRQSDPLAGAAALRNELLGFTLPSAGFVPPPRAPGFVGG